MVSVNGSTSPPSKTDPRASRPVSTAMTLCWRLMVIEPLSPGTVVVGSSPVIGVFPLRVVLHDVAGLESVVEHDDGVAGGPGDPAVAGREGIDGVVGRVGEVGRRGGLDGRRASDVDDGTVCDRRRHGRDHRDARLGRSDGDPPDARAVGDRIRLGEEERGHREVAGEGDGAASELGIDVRGDVRDSCCRWCRRTARRPRSPSAPWRCGWRTPRRSGSRWSCPAGGRCCR